MLISNDYSLSWPSFKPSGFKPSAQGGVVAIGNFDGVHKGHQALLAQACAIADQKNCPCVVLTFAPHPRRFFQPHAPNFMLYDIAQRETLLLAQGVDEVVTLSFDHALSQLSAENFIQHILHDGLHAQHIVVGQNFVFGHGRTGHVDTLMAHGFDVTALAAVTQTEGSVYSSTSVRQAIQNHDFKKVESILGRAWHIQERVIKGAQRGRTLGFPTANMMWPDDIIEPAFGVYHVVVKLTDGTWKDGIANFGLRPTINPIVGNTDKPLLEVHLFDFASDLYGQELQVTPRHFIRSEQTFPDLTALQAQITQDVRTAQGLIS
jgi:riboflavin kinase/FMN adenylyltransferase